MSDSLASAGLTVTSILVAAIFVLLSALSVGTLVSCALRRLSDPRQSARNRFRELRAFSLISSKEGGLALGHAGDGAEEGSLVQDQGKKTVLIRAKAYLADAINGASQLPVLRVLILPFVAKIEEQRLQALRDSCMNDLPEMVDILSLSLGAGLSIDQAFEWYLSNYDTPLAGGFRRAEQAYQVGMLSRMKAFENLAESLQEEAVLRFVNALRQAFILGSELGPALNALSQDVRKYRAVRIEERIAKTPVKILAPLGLCIVPAVLILLIGPIMSQVLQGLQL